MHLVATKVFMFGKVPVYIERGVVFFLNTESKSWQPINLDELLARAQ
jgi:hypothetical protein